MARKGTLTLDPKMVEFGKQFPKDSAERKSWDYHTLKAAEYDALMMKLANPKFDQDARVPDKHRAEYDELLKKIDRARSIMFQSFDNFTRMTKHTVTVDRKEIEAVVYQTLMSNADTVGRLDDVSGLERGREAKLIAFDVVKELSDAHVHIREDDSLEPAYCDECFAEIEDWHA